MAEQKQTQNKVFSALSSETSEENLSFVISLMLTSLVRTRLKSKAVCCIAECPYCHLLYGVYKKK